MKRTFLQKLFILVVALATLASAFALVLTLTLGAGVAFADSAEDAEKASYIKALVSNLEGNEYAGVGTVAVRGADNDEREFLIPESYFVKVEKNILDTFYEVSYAGQNFYMPINTAFVPSEETFAQDEAFYPEVQLTLAENADLSALEGVDSQLKKLDSTYTINFLGYAADPETPDLIYIMATPEEGKPIFGFIPRSAFEAFNVPYQKRAQTERDELLAQKEQLNPPAGPGSLPAPSGSMALKIILILGISLPAVIIVILLFVPSRRGEVVRKTRGASSDGRDYDDPNVPAPRYRSDRQDYDQSRSYSQPPYDGPNGYGGQNGYGSNGYGGNGYGGNGYGGQNGYGDPRGYDPRMGREVRGYDPNDPNNDRR